MKKTIKKKQLVMIIGLLTGFIVHAQTNLTFTVLNEPYQNLEGSTSLNNGMLWDDPQFTIPLGFDFQLGNEIFDTIYIVENGTGGSLSSSQIENGNPQNYIVAILQDIIDLGENNGGESLSNISFLVEGNDGDKIVKIEYNNVGFIEDNTGNDFINIQVWLYENTNTIEYRFGESSVMNPNQSYEEFPGVALGVVGSVNEEGVFFDNAYFLEGNPASPNLITFSSGDMAEGNIPSLVGNIPDGMVYRFSPEVLSTDVFFKTPVAMYPNPASNSITISTKESTIENVFIYDVNGRVLKETTANEVDVSGIDPGMYLAEIILKNGKRMSDKIVIK